MPLHGPAGIFGSSCECCARLAAEEANVAAGRCRAATAGTPTSRQPSPRGPARSSVSLPGLDRRPDREQGRPRRRPHLRAHAQRAGAGAGAAPASSPATARRFFRRPAPRLLQGHLGHPRPADHSHHIHGVCYTGITLPDRFGTESSAELLARRNARGQVSIDTDRTGCRPSHARLSPTTPWPARRAVTSAGGSPRGRPYLHPLLPRLLPPATGHRPRTEVARAWAD